MKQAKLFDLPETPIVERKNKSALTCRSCKHRYKHQYGKMFYCHMNKQKGTAYGDKKIKAGDKACEMFEHI